VAGSNRPGQQAVGTIPPPLDELDELDEDEDEDLDEDEEDGSSDEDEDEDLDEDEEDGSSDEDDDDDDSPEPDEDEDDDEEGDEDEEDEDEEEEEGAVKPCSTPPATRILALLQHSAAPSVSVTMTRSSASTPPSRQGRTDWKHPPRPVYPHVFASRPGPYLRGPRSPAEGRKLCGLSQYDEP
jgi:hypothetical protein